MPKVKVKEAAKTTKSLSDFFAALPTPPAPPQVEQPKIEPPPAHTPTITAPPPIAPPTPEKKPELQPTENATTVPTPKTEQTIKSICPYCEAPIEASTSIEHQRQLYRHLENDEKCKQIRNAQASDPTLVHCSQKGNVPVQTCYNCILRACLDGEEITRVENLLKIDHRSKQQLV